MMLPLLFAALTADAADVRFRETYTCRDRDHFPVTLRATMGYLGQNRCLSVRGQYSCSWRYVYQGDAVIFVMDKVDAEYRFVGLSPVADPGTRSFVFRRNVGYRGSETLTVTIRDADGLGRYVLVGDQGVLERRELICEREDRSE
jgi:hypothetical protein